MYAVEMKGEPSFRQFLEDMHYVQAPGRFPIHTAYVEVNVVAVSFFVLMLFLVLVLVTTKTQRISPVFTCLECTIILFLLCPFHTTSRIPHG